MISMRVMGFETQSLPDLRRFKTHHGTATGMKIEAGSQLDGVQDNRQFEAREFSQDRSNAANGYHGRSDMLAMVCQAHATRKRSGDSIWRHLCRSIAP